MLKKRLVAVLIIRDGRVVQSVRFQHTNSIHYNPVHALDCFNRWSVDEIVILNVSREQNSQDEFASVVKEISRKCFVPLTVGGWITDADYARRLLNVGADKLVVNSIVNDDPELVKKLSRRFGRQCIVVSMDLKRNEEDRALVMVDRGRRSTGSGPEQWARKAVELGAGEIFFNSIDHDGARGGYDLDSLKLVCAEVAVPVIAFGGVFRWEHLVEGIEAGADAVGAANIFHYTEHATMKAKRFMAEANILVRDEGQRISSCSIT